MVKESKKEPEESELEEALEETEESKEGEKEIQESEDDFEIENFRLNEFIRPPAESGAPVLSQIAEAPSQQIFRLEEDVGSSPTLSQNNEDDVFNYSATPPTENEETKYTSSSELGAAPERVNMRQIGRGRIDELQGAGLKPSSELSGTQSSQDRYLSEERIDTEKIGRENPFETRLKSVERKKSEYFIK